MFKPSLKNISIASILAPLMAAGSAMAQAVDAAAAVEHAVVRMHVEVHEVSADGFRVGHAGR